MDLFGIPSLYNVKDKDIPADAVYIGRGTPYGNPFVIGRHGDRNEVCDRFEKEVLPYLDVEPLRGKPIVCHCRPLRCHGQAILNKLYG